jgi:hypothetical protein
LTDGDDSVVQKHKAVVDFIDYIVDGSFENYAEKNVSNPEEPPALESYDSMEYDSSQTEEST